MAIETEIKFAVDSLDSVAARLLSLGGRPENRGVLETNEFFDRPDGSLRAADCAIRLRTLTPLSDAQNAGRPREFLLTYKGPRLRDTRLKSRQEVQTPVGDGPAVEQILQAAGLVVTCTIQKRRHGWLMDDCRVELDELPLIGFFVEIEGERAAIERLAAKLGLPGEPVLKSYVELLERRCLQFGRPFDKVLFAPDAPPSP
jgi:adenylate cyclase class 2